MSDTMCSPHYFHPIIKCERTFRTDMEFSFLLDEMQGASRSAKYNGVDEIDSKNSFNSGILTEDTSIFDMMTPPDSPLPLSNSDTNADHISEDQPSIISHSHSHAKSKIGLIPLTVLVFYK